MILTVLSSVFNGTDDSDIVSVDMPKAYLRFIVSQSVGDIIWLDENYNRTAVTSEQQAILEDGLTAVTDGANA